MLSRFFGAFEISEYFKHYNRARQLWVDLEEDRSFLATMGRFLSPFATNGTRSSVAGASCFPPRRALNVPALEGKKIGLVATGGSGAMLCTLGVVRACEEAGLEIAAISSCSGSAVALAPVAAGLSAEQAAAFILGWGDRDYLEVDRGALRGLLLDRGRGMAGLFNAAGVERLLEARFGDLRVGRLSIPFYANLWDIARNRVTYPGTRTRPEVSLARLTRTSMSLAGFVSPVEIDGVLYGDGGAVNIFPVDPLMDHHPEIDFFIGVNAFYPEGFAGEDISGFFERPWSLLSASRQSYTCQHIEVARQQLRRIEERCLMLQPLSYKEVAGIKLFELMIDRTRWPEFIAQGHRHARAALAGLRSSDQARDRA